jgi:hypothetical protein
MGQLHYGAPPATYEIDDRALAHVELVIIAKLRRGENFALTLPGESDGRSTVWITTAATLRFEYATEVGEINREWLEELLDSANTTAGMRLVEEPAKV